jgi:uroporphyrinogen-III synthase
VNRRPLLVVRPEPGNAATLAAAQALGLAAHGEPLFRVVPRPWTPPPAAEFDALLIGSGNVLRHGGPALGNYEALPAYVVGETTAQAARAAGFTVGATGSGGLQDLVPRLVEDGHRRVLRLAGAEHVPLRAGPDTGIETVVVYAAETLQLGNAAAAVLAQQPFVLLHSAAAAARFAAECDRLRVDRGTISLACLGPRVAAAAGIGWASVASAERPSDSALLALAAGMCQTGAFGKTDANN